MKKIILIFITLLGSVIASAVQIQPGYFTIEGYVKDLVDSAVVTLKAPIPRGYMTIASDTVTDGRFQFSDTLSTPSKILYITVNTRGYSQSPLHVWVSPGDTTRIEGSGKIPVNWNVSSPVPEQESFRRIYEAQLPEYEEVLKVGIQESRLLDSLFIDLKGDSQAFDNIFGQVKKLRESTEELDSIVTRKKIAYMQTSPVDYEWLNEFYYLVLGLKGNNDTDYHALIRNLGERIKGNNSDKARAISDMLSVEKPVGKGDIMVDGELWDINGNRHKLSEFTESGKYILLDFWSCTCGPCVQSMEEMEMMAELHKDKLTVIGISLDDKAIWKEALEKYQPSGEQLNQLLPEGMGLSPRYGVTGIPQYVMINPEGVIVDMWSGYGTGHLKKNIERNF